MNWFTKEDCYPVFWHYILINFVCIILVCQLYCLVAPDVCETFLVGVHVFLHSCLNPPSFHWLQISLSALCISQTMKFTGIRYWKVQCISDCFYFFLYLFRIDLQVLFILLWQFIDLSSMLDWTVTFSHSYKHLRLSPMFLLQRMVLKLNI